MTKMTNFLIYNHPQMMMKLLLSGSYVWICLTVWLCPVLCSHSWQGKTFKNVGSLLLSLMKSQQNVIYVHSISLKQRSMFHCFSKEVKPPGSDADGICWTKNDDCLKVTLLIFQKPKSHPFFITGGRKWHRKIPLNVTGLSPSLLWKI